ncbi:RimK family alpha-L-glutamate ligase [bacterium]|nr:RimK family alpha-L-glutamate ligase [bacterium]
MFQSAIHSGRLACFFPLESLTLKLGILANEGSWYWADLARAAAPLGHTCERLDFARLATASGFSGSARHSTPYELLAESDAAMRPLANFDAIIVRTMPPGSLEQVVFRMDALGRLEAAGTPVVNPPRSIECAVDKFLTTARLEAAGLPVPRTVTCQDSETAMQAFESLGRDVIVKPLFGAEGRGICRVSDPDLAFRTFRTLERIDAVLYLQEFVRHPGHDVRVLVLGGEIVGSIRRYADSDFRTNVAISGRAEIHSATGDEQRLALAASDAVGTDFAGIDLLYDEAGRCFVIEVNAVPGWQAFQRTTGIDVATRFLGWVKGRVIAP